VTELGGNGAREVVEGEVELSEVGQVAELGGDGAREPAPAENQCGLVPEGAIDQVADFLNCC
jgi:hypothetical protein